MKIVRENGAIYAVMDKYDSLNMDRVRCSCTGRTYKICEHKPFQELLVEVDEEKARLRSEIEFELGVR